MIIQTMCVVMEEFITLVIWGDIRTEKTHLMSGWLKEWNE